MDGKAIVVTGADALAKQQTELIFFPENPFAFAMDVVHIHRNVHIDKSVLHIVLIQIENSAIAQVDDIPEGVLHRLAGIYREVVVILGKHHRAGQIHKLDDKIVKGEIRFNALHKAWQISFDLDKFHKRRHTGYQFP